MSACSKECWFTFNVIKWVFVFLYIIDYVNMCVCVCVLFITRMFKDFYFCVCVFVYEQLYVW